ncbi:hypothetical protein BC830DRAFT_1084211 [Chytriomyces sp. MP71]|nr:hypothetical protein BC830DRAFT_1084211 [Chytriomyces sp. MP71]
MSYRNLRADTNELPGLGHESEAITDKFTDLATATFMMMAVATTATAAKLWSALGFKLSSFVVFFPHSNNIRYAISYCLWLLMSTIENGGERDLVALGRERLKKYQKRGKGSASASGSANGSASGNAKGRAKGTTVSEVVEDGRGSLESVVTVSSISSSAHASLQFYPMTSSSSHPSQTTSQPSQATQPTQPTEHNHENHHSLLTLLVDEKALLAAQNAQLASDLELVHAQLADLVCYRDLYEQLLENTQDIEQPTAASPNHHAHAHDHEPAPLSTSAAAHAQAQMIIEQELRDANKMLRDQIASLQMQLDTERALKLNEVSMTANLEKITYQTSLIAQMEKELEAARSSAGTPPNANHTTTTAITTDTTTTIAQLTASVTDLTSRLAEREETLESIFAQLSEAHTHTQTVDATLQTREAELASLQAANENLAAQVENLLAQVQCMSVANSENETGMRGAEAARAHLTERHAVELGEVRVAWAAEVAALHQTLAATERAMDLGRVDSHSQMEKMAALEKRVGGLLADNQALMEQLAELRYATIGVANEKAALVDQLFNANAKVQKLLMEVEMLEGLKEEAKLLKEIVRTGGSSSLAVASMASSFAHLPTGTEAGTTYATQRLVARNGSDEFIGALNERALDQALGVATSATVSSAPPTSANTTTTTTSEHTQDTSVALTITNQDPAQPSSQHSTFAPGTGHDASPTEAATPTAPTPTPAPAQINPLQSKLDLEREVKALRQTLAEERHRTELLAAELECVPDYIQLYHKERKVLLSQLKASTAATAAGVTSPTTVMSPNHAEKSERRATVGEMPMMKRPPELRGFVGDRSVVCGPCADCSGRVFIL